MISRTSTTACEIWVVKGWPVSAAQAAASRSSSGVTVSICPGNTTPRSRPLGCRSAAAITRCALWKPRVPPASSQVQVTVCGALMPQRAEAKAGATYQRMPDAAMVSNQPSKSPVRSIAVVVPQRSISL